MRTRTRLSNQQLVCVGLRLSATDEYDQRAIAGEEVKNERELDIGGRVWLEPLSSICVVDQ